MVYADRTFELWGQNPDVRKNFAISQSEYDQIIKLVRGVRSYLEKDVRGKAAYHAPAEVTYRTRIKRVHIFSNVDVTYARLVLEFEEILKLKNFTCPKVEFVDGDIVGFGCENEARILNTILKGGKQ